MSIHSASVPRVLIVGSGPTGLTLAIALRRYGIAVRIIERKDHLSRFTKATNLMQRNQEILHALGVLAPLNEISGFMSRLMVHCYGKCYGARTMHLHESPFADVLLCGQHNFEAMMADALKSDNIAVEFSTELRSLQQDGTGVNAELTTSNGSETARFEYVVGCDGARGITRTFTRHNFEPSKTGVAVRQVDCKLTWRRLSTMDQLWLFYFQNGFATIVPLPGGIHRVLTIEPKANMPERNPTLEEMQAKLRTVTADNSLTLTDADWFSYTDLSMGIASGLRDGRILMAGDASNPILPNGGQGMNTGISDAFNLGWKLAAVMNSDAPEALLDSYEYERLKFRNTLQNAQYNSLKYTTLITPKWMQTLIVWFAEPLLNRGGEYKMAEGFSQLTVNTRNSPLTLEKMGKAGLRAGDRALDVDIVQGNTSIRLYDLIYAGGWTLLAFTGTEPNATPALTAALKNLPIADLSAHIVTTHADIVAVPSVNILYDLDEVAHRVYKVAKPTVYLIRPDGYVGARVSPRETGLLHEYLAKWLPSGGAKVNADTRSALAICRASLSPLENVYI